jgi:hypothetical protein
VLLGAPYRVTRDRRIESDAELVQAVFQSALDFVERVPVRRLTFVPDARAWELIG